MPHSPPVPPGNQSPYPRVEPPHEKPASAADNAQAPRSSSSHRPVTRRTTTSGNGVRIGVAALLGLGAVAALVAGIVTAARQSDTLSARRRPAGKGKGGKR